MLAWQSGAPCFTRRAWLILPKNFAKAIDRSGATLSNFSECLNKISLMANP
jgi:hypothetical protein